MPDVLQRLPVQPLTARAVLKRLDDPDASSAELARLVTVDPALSAAVLRVANAPHLGHTGRVSSARHAVVLLGARTVTSLAAGAAASLVLAAEGAQVATPEGFWTHAITVACGASVVARRLGVNADDAFSAGVLHDIGVIALARRQPRVVDLTALSATALLDAEHDLAGTDHTELGALVLRRWFLPAALVQAVRLHHTDPAGITDPLAKALVAGHALAARVDGSAGRDRPTKPGEVLSAIGLPDERPAALVAEVADEVHRVVGWIKEAA